MEENKVPVVKEYLITDHVDPSMQRLYAAASELMGIPASRGCKAKIARLLGVGQDSICNWEKRGMSAGAMIAAENLIGCSAHWLKTGDGEMRKLKKRKK